MKWAAICGGVGLLAFGAGYWFAPTKIEVREKIVTKTEVRRVVDTETRIVERPDGVKETVIVERDRSVEESRSQSDKVKITEKPADKWLITALVGVQRSGLSLELKPQTTAILVQRHVAWGIYAGPWATLNGDFGVGVSFRF